MVKLLQKEVNEKHSDPFLTLARLLVSFVEKRNGIHAPGNWQEFARN